MTTTCASSICTTGQTNGLLEDIHDFITDATCQRVHRFLESGEMPALDYYTNHQVDALEYLEHSVYFMDACLLINRIDRNVVVAGIEALHQEKKAVELYRLYAPTLRRIVARKSVNSGNARDLLNSMYLEQTRPDAELDGADFIDGYTGEKIEDDDAFEVGKACAKFFSLSGAGKTDGLHDVAIIQASNNAAADLGWDEKTRAQFLAAQAGFDQNADEPEMGEDDRAYEPPTFLQPADYISEDSFELRELYTKINAIRAKIIGEMKHDGVPAEFWKDEYRLRITVPAKHFLHKLASITDDEDYQMDMTALVLRGVKLDLGEAVDVPERHMSVDMPYSEEDPDRIDPSFFEDLKKTYNQVQTNPINTADYNIAKITATIAGSTLDEANKQAWQAWKSHKAQIKSILGNKSGLILDSGRQISWKVAQMKLAAKELDLDDCTKTRLSKKLTELHISNGFTTLLAK